MKKLFKSRLSLLFAFQVTFLLLSFLTRCILFSLSIPNLSFSIINIIKIFFYGFYFDIGVSVFFSIFYAFYLVLIPQRFMGSLIDKIFTFIIFTLMLFIVLFALAAEFPFWDEFNTRFNFIAVDYLIYTYEVVENINQSYPIPLLVAGLLSVILLIFFIYKKFNIFTYAFRSKTPFFKRLLLFIFYVGIATAYAYFANNKQAEWSDNTYENELSKNGVFSFFAAFRANELDYNTFYKTLNQKEAYAIIKKELLQSNNQYTSPEYDNIKRKITPSQDTIATTTTPNIIMVTIESLSADFLGVFGNKENLTPHIDALAKESILFTNLYATGTRTVRGMEALTLCVPPTPGNSIVRRPNNENIFSIANVLKTKNYDLKFIYGGDGYFDNMNTFFGGQGFDIVDRDRGNPLSDDIKTTRYPIADKEVSFENAWGISDEDIYKQALKYADLNHSQNQPFFQFVMTTSNHKPYSFPEGKIDMPQGSRESAVKYTDYALHTFIQQAKTKPWFKNTIFIIVADHCASSAGKWEINIEKHHIPAMIYNAGKAFKVNKLCSQIDLMPTVFSYLNWEYTSAFYGKDIFSMQPREERALIANYRTLGLLKENIFTQLNDRKQSLQYHWNAELKEMKEIQPNTPLVNLTISYYQTASDRFKNGKMKN